MAKETPNERERLAEVHTSDLNESRVNEEFVDWLKGPGTNILLVCVLAILGYVIFLRVQDSRSTQRTAAWSALSNAVQPDALAAVASTPDFAKHDAIATLARLNGAERLMVAVRTGQQLPESGIVEPGTEPVELTDEQRSEYLDRADRFYTDVIDDALNAVPSRAVLVWSALCGRGAVAESRGDVDAARDFYTQAAERIEPIYPALSERARVRADTAGDFVGPVTLPSDADVTDLIPPRATPVRTDDVLSDIIDGAADDDAP